MATLRRTFLVLLAVALIGFLVAGSIAAWEGAATFVDPRNPETPGEQPEEVADHYRFECGDVEIDVFRVDAIGEKNEGAVDTALILHGKADQKTSMAGLGRRFARAGVQAILVDLRGHGASTRTEITYGAREREDLSCVLDSLEAEGVQIGELGVFGSSYGGAVALQFAGTDSRVNRVVAVAGFRSFEASATSSIRLPAIAQWAVITAAGLRGGFDPDDASPEATIGGTEADVILVYSRDDQIVPYSHGVAVAAACGEHCRLVTLEGYDHLGTLSNPELRDLLHRHFAAASYP
ncbi:MAG: pimeloyl-ACP methyl ester carboxylesterase [Polyangiales bacterium]|jgi:pimeloyl-ACP methyl ester carboxylesterase